MRHLIRVLATAFSLAGGAVAAQGTVIELYTSQGCSSCPPADAMLHDLAQRDDVIALALHVDYWDYIGWVDDLADPSYTRRQQAYARAANAATVYTPQMIIGGVDHVIGSRPMAVMDQVAAHGAAPDAVQVELARSGNMLTIQARPTGRRQEAVVQVVRYVPSISRDIRRGENAGRTISYANVVTSWQVVQSWDMGAPLTMQAQISGDDPVVVIVQDGTDGPILGAAQLR